MFITPFDDQLTKAEKKLVDRFYQQGIFNEWELKYVLDGFLAQPVDGRDLASYAVHHLEQKSGLGPEQSQQLVNKVSQLMRDFENAIPPDTPVHPRDETLPLAALTASQESDLPHEAIAAGRNPANRIGRYVRVEKLGAGGMGEVWKCWDSDLRRWAALKFLKQENPTELARFKREAQTAAKLNHPNIAAVYDVGEHEGHHYIAMQYVNGQTLQDISRTDRKLLVELVRDAALAVHAAHEAGVIHRDIKPSNIMVEGIVPKGKTQRSPREQKPHKARVYVMDFGLAKQQSAGASITMPGFVVGTPWYMAPEQAEEGKARLVSPRSDVYSLGVTLYELLTGRKPFDHPDVYQVLQRVISEDPLSVRKLNPLVGQDLDTIVMKCLEKKPDRRYASAKEFADDLTRYLEGDAITAHPPSVGYRIGKAIGRRKAVIGMFAVGLGAAGIVAGFGLPKLLRASEDKRKAEEALAAAQREKEREQRRKRAEEKLRFAEQHLEDGNLEAALALATEVIQYDPDFGKAYYVRGSATYLQWKAETIDAAIKDFELADKKNMDFLQAHDHRALWDAAMACLDIKDSVNQAVQFSKRALESTPPQDAAHPQKPFFLLHQSLNAFVEKQYKEAIEHAEEARRLNPKMARAMYLLSMYHSESMISPFNAQGLRQFRDYKKALAYIDGAVQQSPNHFRYLVHSARMNSYAGDSQRGLEHAGRVLTIDPGFSEAHYFKANALFRLDRIEDCLAELNALERKNKGRLEYHHLGLKGTVQFNQRQYDQAMESFTASLKLKESYSAYTYRGQTLMELDKVEEAIADFTTALKMNKEYGSAYLGRGRAYVKLKRYQEALSDFDNAGKHGQPQGYDFKEKVERWLREHEQ